MIFNCSCMQEKNHSKRVFSGYWNQVKIVKHNRLGRGKGFYDRLLSTLDVPKIGICYDFQLKDQIPAEPFDRKMDLIITEKEIL